MKCTSSQNVKPQMNDLRFATNYDYNKTRIVGICNWFFLWRWYKLDNYAKKIMCIEGYKGF